MYSYILTSFSIMSNENTSVNYLHFDNNQNKEKNYNGYNGCNITSCSQYKELYTNTNTNNAKNGNSNKKITVGGQHFVKDMTKPFTYYSISNEIYENEYHHDESDCDYYSHDNSGLEDDGCFKLYFCGLIGCCLLCTFGCKHF